MDQKQFKEEVLPLRGQMMIYAQKFFDNKEDAEDIIQELFLKLWHMRNELPNYNNIPALSTTIVKNLSINKLKLIRRETNQLEGLHPTDEESSISDQLEAKDRLCHVMQIMNQLPDLQQSILRMKHIDGYEVEEIAELIGSTSEAVRMNLSRGRKRVKELFLNLEKNDDSL
ncbi:MAG: RNA polymerase sigma factor [Dysgonamonadaceae bacterium]|jgi:RNA polymerase sigma-70 factor (ECF subfamily)|nr:RNA polymerase sigma factor [Dysgonamonadaceae bacterium]